MNWYESIIKIKIAYTIIVSALYEFLSIIYFLLFLISTLLFLVNQFNIIIC